MEGQAHMMLQQPTMWCGTDTGLVSLRVDNGQWQQSGALLPGKPVIGLAFGGDEATVIYAAVQGYGLFKTGDGAQSWQQILAANAQALLQDGQNRNRLWVGTEPAGIFRTTDGGQHWTDLSDSVRQIPSALDWSYSEPPYQARLRSIQQHPTQVDTILAGIEDGGAIRSTDGGESWRQSDVGLDEGVLALAVQPTKPDFWLAGTGQGIYRSRDVGRSWQALATELPYEVAYPILVLPSGLCLANLAATLPGNWIENAVSTLYRSEDEGNTWQAVVIEPNQPSYITALSHNPFEAGTIYAGTQNGTIYWSKNYGQSWEKIGQLAARIHTIVSVSTG